MKKLITLCLGVAAATLFADTIQVANLKIGQIDNGTKVQVSWHIDGAGWSAYYSVALTRAESPDAPATSRTIIEPYDLNFWQTSPDCSLTDTPPQTGKRYYYWLHISADFSFQMAYLMGYYDNIKMAPCLGPFVGWTGTLADQPKAPTELVASYDTDGTGIAIAWNAGGNAKAYNVYRADVEDESQLVMIAKDFSSLSGVDRSPVPGRDYYYAVKSVNEGTESAEFSPMAKGRRLLLAPTDVRASLVKCDTAAELIWTAEPCAESYDIYAGLTSNFAEATKIVENKTVCCHTNVLAGEFAVKSHWYWIVSKNTYVESKPSDSAQLAVLPPTAVEVFASGADIAGGSITLSWRFPDGRELPKGMTFSVARKVNDGKSSAVELTSTESTMSYTDSTWGASGKTATISYWVWPNADGWPISNECVTRKRYGVFVGIDRFQNDWCKRLRYCEKDGEALSSLFWTRGNCSGSRRLYNEHAKRDDILDALEYFGSSVLKPGDIFLFSVSTHGGVYSDGSGYMCCYDYANGDGVRLSGQQLGNAFLTFPSGIGVIAIIDTCHADSMVTKATASKVRMRLTAAPVESGAGVSWANAFIEDVNQAMSEVAGKMKTLSVAPNKVAVSFPKLTSSEIGWITAVAADQSAFDGWFTSECICEAGWKYGGADYDTDDYVTFGELADFAKAWQRRAVRIRPTGDLQPGSRHENILAAVVAGEVEGHSLVVSLRRPDGLATVEMRAGVVSLSWDPVEGAQKYAIMRYAEGSSITTRVATVSNATSWTDGMDSALEPGVKYHYYVAAINPMDISECSDSVGCVATEDPQLVSYVNRTFAHAGSLAVPSALRNDGSVNYSTVNLDHDNDGLTTFQEYVAGTDPIDENSVFQATISMENGSPVVHWSPDLNTNEIVRDYVVWGKTNLTDTSWHSPTNEWSRFFKVEVRLR